MNEVLIRIEAPHFVAGLIVDGGVVVRTAPILSWARHKAWRNVAAYVETKRGWRWRAWTE